MMNIMVTGATGFLGANLVRLLAASGMNVTATKRRGANTWRLTSVDNIRMVEMDISNRQEMEKAVACCRPDIVINCIAYGVDPVQADMRLAIAVNINGAADLLMICAGYGVKRFIHMGSCFEYGSKTHPVRENELLEPTGMYGATKAAASILLLETARKLKTNLLVLRLFGIWGPLESRYRLVPQIITACRQQKPLSLTGCTQVRDHTYVVDMARYIKTIATGRHFPANEVINLGTGLPVTLRDFVNAIAMSLDGLPLMQFGKLPFRPGEMFYLVADTCKAQQVLGRVERTSLTDGLSAMISSHQY